MRKPKHIDSYDYNFILGRTIIEDSKFYNVFGPDGSQIGTVVVTDADGMDSTKLRKLLDEMGDDEYAVVEIPAGDGDTLTVSEIVAGFWFNGIVRGEE